MKNTENLRPTKKVEDRRSKTLILRERLEAVLDRDKSNLSEPIADRMGDAMGDEVPNKNIEFSPSRRRGRR